MTTPNGKTLPWTQRDGVKIGHLVAEPVDHEFAPGLRGIVWGYNGGTPGPTLEAVEGDRLRIYVTNRLPEPTTVHWHGLIIPNGMDGVAGLNQKPIPPGETWVYEFTVKHPGTYMYHSHYDEMVQIALGLKGMFVVHPKRPRGPRVDREIDLDQMTTSSDLVLHGRVREAHVEAVAGNERHLRTVVEIDVIELLKGERTRKSVRLELPGGRLGKWAMLIPGMPTFTTGEELVLFLEALPATATRPDGFARINLLFLPALFTASVPLPPTRRKFDPLEQCAQRGGIDDDSVRAISNRWEFEGASGQPLAKETPARAIEPNRSAKATVTTQEQV